MPKILDKWAMKYTCCEKCGTTSLRHMSHGLCVECYQPYRYEMQKAWKKYPCCVQCGSNRKSHHAKGFCTSCYNQSKKSKHRSILEKPVILEKTVFSVEEFFETLKMSQGVVYVASNRKKFFSPFAEINNSNFRKFFAWKNFLEANLEFFSTKL